MKTMIGVKTFRKNDVLQCLLTSLSGHGYTLDTEIVIADDNPGEAFPIFKANPFVKAYLAGSRHGIAYNSNRLLRYFLHNSDCERLLLLDNDICFSRSGMLDEYEKASATNGVKHIAAYIIDSDGGDGLQTAFPYRAISKDGSIKWHPGSHGIAQWYTRDIIEKIGYFVRMPYFYGGEHSEHSNRALYSQDVDPELYPVLARSTKYIVSCPINFHAYDVDLSRTFTENHRIMHERLNKTKQGLDIKEFNSHLDMDREVVCTQDWGVYDPARDIIKFGRKRSSK